VEEEDEEVSDGMIKYIYYSIPMTRFEILEV
jgi:hypothetical protein